MSKKKVGPVMSDSVNSPIAIAIVGMCGAGKSVVAEYLRSKNWFYIRFGQVTIDEMNRQNLAINEQNERKIREELRIHGGMGVYAEVLWPEIEKKLQSGSVVIDGLYSWSEYRVLKEHLGGALYVVAIVAHRATRYARLASRVDRPLSQKDAEQRDVSEIENLEKGGPIAIADFTLLNENSIDDLRSSIEILLERLP